MQIKLEGRIRAVKTYGGIGITMDYKKKQIMFTLEEDVVSGICNDHNLKEKADLILLLNRANKLIFN